MSDQILNLIIKSDRELIVEFDWRFLRFQKHRKKKNEC